MSTATMISTDPLPVSNAGTKCPELKILLAEHDRNMRRLASIALRFDGHRVEEASDGSEMLEAIAGTIMDGGKRPFDMIIMADDLPGIAGFTALAGLRSRKWDTPFILMTDDFTLEARARRLGAVVLGRPRNVAAIRNAVLKAHLLRGMKLVGLP
jgi:DNA-binding response OmpR family regulator